MQTAKCNIVGDELKGRREGEIVMVMGRVGGVDA